MAQEGKKIGCSGLTISDRCLTRRMAGGSQRARDAEGGDIITGFTAHEMVQYLIGADECSTTFSTPPN